jgi:pSer/pThr/pTyr-binding forkhead associated (FHA) protein
LPWTIGRAATCTIRLGDTHASREHARLDAAGEDFVLHDLNSANGTTVNGLRIRDCKIADGDTIRICDAALVVRLGSRPVTDAPRSQPDRRMPVVLVPGLCGSELLMGRITMWPNVLRSLSCPEESIPEYWGALQIGSAVRETVVIPGLVKMEAFGRLVDFLCQELDYADGVDLVEFAYDWRQDNRQSAGLLKERVATWRKGLPDPQTKIVFIAHSMGGLICRYFLEHLGGADLCDRLILLGTPNRGSTRIFSTTIFGRGALAFPIGGSRIRRMMQHFPSVYQLLPTYTSIRLDDGSTFLPYADDQWLSAEFRPMLESGRSFRKELTATERATVPTTCVFGYGQRTLAGITVSRERDGTLKLLDEQFENAGDDSVTENSAVLDRAEIHPVRQRHGALYADKDVQRRLRYELLERHRRG